MNAEKLKPEQTNKKENTEVPNDSKKPAEYDADWGYDLYPERKGNKKSLSAVDYLLGYGNENLDKMKCERTVYQCIKTSPLVKLMMGALKASGCAIDIRRHLACEECDVSVTGGYDPLLNQIVVCQNTATKKGIVQGVLTHEMIHMFDYCRNDVNFKNIDHLACTEIRAANLAHCSFLSAWLVGDVSVFNVKAAHQNCVKSKALKSVLSVRDITVEKAQEAIDRVFPKCYADLEPIGRRIRRNSHDMYRAHEEGFMYGYDNPY